MTSRPGSRFFACELLFLALTGCGANESTPAPAAAPAASVKPPKVALLSKLRVDDPSAPTQLAKGFYGLETSWRWTAAHFSVILKTPPGAAASGATLTFSFAISGEVLKQVHAQTLTASVAGKTIKSETFLTPGNHTFTAAIPAELLSGDSVTVSFAIDKPLPPSPADRRELGVVATAIGIESK